MEANFNNMLTEIDEEEFDEINLLLEAFVLPLAPSEEDILRQEEARRFWDARQRSKMIDLQLPKCRYSSETKDLTQDTCPICLIDYEEGETVRKLRCRHEFHSECIMHWLTPNSTCPVCRGVAIEKHIRR